MMVIRPNCRVQFTAEDIDFILRVLGPKAGCAETIASLLGDEETRDLILDDDALANERVRRDLAARPNRRVLLDLDERADLGVRSDLATIEVDQGGVEDLHVLRQLDGVRNRGRTTSLSGGDAVRATWASQCSLARGPATRRGGPWRRSPEAPITGYRRRDLAASREREGLDYRASSQLIIRSPFAVRRRMRATSARPAPG